MKCRLFPAVSLLLVLAAAARAAPPPAPPDTLAPALPASEDVPEVPPTGYFISADSSRAERLAGEEVIRLVGNVLIRHGTIELRSPRAVNYRGRGVTHFRGGVRIVDGDLHLRGEQAVYERAENVATLLGQVHIVDPEGDIRCSKAVYHRSTGRADLTGDVVLRDSLQTLSADTVTYWRDDGFAEARSNVVIRDLERDLLVRGRHGTYDRARGLGIVDDGPVLVSEPEGEEPTYVESRVLRMNMDTSVGEAVGEVVLKRGNTWAWCDSAVFYQDEEKAVLLGHPRAEQEDVRMSGTRMILFYHGDSVRRIELEEEARIDWEDAPEGETPRTSWIEGDDMSLFLVDNQLDSLMVAGDARSLYYPERRPQERRISTNQAAGDTLSFTFEDRQLTRAHVKGRASGVYRYYDLESGETADTLVARADTSLSLVDFGEKATEVEYSARSIHYFSENEDIVLRGDAKVVQGDRILEAKDIDFNSRLEVMEARGSPVLTEKRDKVYGDAMDYDMESKVGMIQEGTTQYGEGYYTGKRITKVGEKTLKVRSSTYTTCDLKVPHYHFESNRMKIYVHDKVVSGPIRLYIGKVPIAYLPFMAASIRRGRRSGFLRPDFEFGIFDTGSRFVRNIGYYWATSDYTDFLLRGDYNEDRNLHLEITNRYKKRYLLDGQFRIDLVRDLTDYTMRWEFTSRHTQEVLPFGFRGSSNLHFVSDDQVRREITSIDDVERYVDRFIESTANVSRRWSFASVNVSANRRQRLEVTRPGTQVISETFPSVRLSLGRKSLWLFGESERKKDRGAAERVLSNVYWTPSFSAERNFTRTLTEVDGDTVEVDRLTHRSNNGLSLSSSLPLSVLNFNQSLNFRHTYFWTDNPDPGQEARRNDLTWNTGASLSTKIYGFFYPRVGRLEGLRHVVTPSVSYRFQPEIRDIQQRSQSFSWSLQNKLDLKLRRPKPKPGEEEGDGTAAAAGEAGGGGSGDSGDGEFEKINDLLVWTLSGAYDPEAPAGRGFTNISSSARSRIWKVGLEMNNTYDPYEGRVLSTNISTGLALNGQLGYGVPFAKEDRELNPAAAAGVETFRPDTSAAFIDSIRTALGPTGYTLSDEEIRSVVKDRSELEQEMEEGKLPWSVNLSFNYRKFRGQDPTSTLTLYSSLNLTPAWTVDYSTSYDVDEQYFVNHNLSITRDLHCWEASFVSSRLGSSAEFYFRISLKAHPNEIFYERGTRGLRGGGRSLPLGY
jgi:lipopolysaccharide assembly outer membrane protein LptD (OstA)